METTHDEQCRTQDMGQTRQDMGQTMNDDSAQECHNRLVGGMTGMRRTMYADDHPFFNLYSNFFISYFLFLYN